jgi:hypothetical protein
MGIVRDTLSKSINFIGSEIMPLRIDLLKAGILMPDGSYEQKASLVDPFSYNATVHGYKEKYSFIDYTKMRQISYSDPIISAIIQTRSNQVGAFGIPQVDRYKSGFRVGMRDKEKKPSPAAKKKIEELNRFIMSCGFEEPMEATPHLKKRDNFEIFLRKIVRDSLTYDQVNFEVVPRRNGQPAQFIAVDAATIRLLPDQHEKDDAFGGDYNGQANDNPLIIQPFQGGKVRPTKIPRLVQVINGTPRATFDEFEMAFGVRNPRTDVLANGYGFSEIEQLITTITAHINAETHNRKFFSQGSAQKGIIAFEGTVPPDQLEAFRRQWHQQVSGVQNAWKTPIVAVGKDSKLNWVSLHASNKDMEWGSYMEYLIKTICGVYQIDPIEIGFDISRNSSGGGTGGLGGQGQQVERLKFSKDKGLDPLLRFIQNMMNEYIIWRIDEDFEFEFVGLNMGSEKDQLDIDKTKVETFMTINELRSEHDLKPLQTTEKVKDAGDMVMSSSFIQAYQALQGAQMAEGDEFGAEGAEGEEAEPDYSQMSDEELQAELDRLQGGSQEQEVGKSIEAMRKSLEVII